MSFTDYMIRRLNLAPKTHLLRHRNGRQESLEESERWVSTDEYKRNVYNNRITVSPSWVRFRPHAAIERTGDVSLLAKLRLFQQGAALVMLADALATQVPMPPFMTHPAP